MTRIYTETTEQPQEIIELLKSALLVFSYQST